MKTTPLHCLLGLSLLCAGSTIHAADHQAATPLFNGRNLDGWYIYAKNADAAAKPTLFEVTDGTLHTYPGAADGSTQPFGYLITTAEYSDYHLTLEYKWGTKKFAPRATPDSVRDAGVCYHVRAPDEIWPICVECQIQEGDTGDVWTVHTRATTRIHPMNMNYSAAPSALEVTKGDKPSDYNRFLRSYSYEKEGWNRVELIVRGDTATYLVNGHVCNRVTGLKAWDAATAAWQPLTKGKILLQAEGAEIFYRNVTLQPLDPLPAA